MPQLDPAFEAHRSALHRLAYRMLGTLADADDVLQEAYLRWTREDRSSVSDPRAYLISVVTRLCIDQQRTQAARRESYIGPWLPEPVVEEASAARSLEVSESVSLALLIVLESLSPVERAAYLLRRVFDYDYPEIASILGKTEANCRQLVSRAEDRVHQRRPRFDAPREEAERITGAFLSACSTGNLDSLVQLLADDAVVYSDGGGKATAARAPIVGADRVARFFLGLFKKAPADLEIRHVQVNGQPGVVALVAGHIENVLTMDVVDGRIAAVYIVRNPDKLARVALPRAN